MKRAFGQWTIIAAVTVAAVYFWVWPAIAVRLGYGFAPGVMPRCDAPFTTALLLKTINDSPAARTLGLKASEVSGAVLVADTRNDVACRADLMSNIGRRAVDYSLRWDGAAKDRVLLEARPWWQ
jgi:hypothetical protein